MKSKYAHTPEMMAAIKGHKVDGHTNYRSIRDTIYRLGKDELIGKMYRIMSDYALDGIEPEFSDDDDGWKLEMVFTSMKYTLDTSRIKSYVRSKEGGNKCGDEGDG